MVFHGGFYDSKNIAYFYPDIILSLKL
jgi:hypothetical protein